MKKLLWLFLILLTGGGLFAAYQYYLSPPENFQAIYLVPKNAIYIIETSEPIKSWQKLSSSKAWKFLQTQSYFGELTSGANALDSMINDNKELFDQFGSRHVLISAHNYKRTDYDFLFIVDLEKAGKLKFLQDYLTNLNGQAGYRVSQRPYNGITITELYDKQSRQTLYLAFISNLLVCSYTNSLVEASIDQREEPVIGRDIRFIEIDKQIDNDGMFKMYMQYSYLDDYMRCYLSEPNEYVNSLSKMLAYTATTIDMDGEEWISMKGATNINDSVSSYMKAMLESGRGKLAAQEVIPQRTAFYVSIAVKNFAEFHNRFEKVMQENSETEYKEYQSNVNKVEGFLKISLKENFINWMGEEVCFVQMQPQGLGRANEFAAVIQADDIEEAKRQMEFIGKQIRKRTPVKIREVDYKGYPIHYMAVKGFFKPILGKLFQKLDKPYFTFIDDYVVFSNHPQTIKSFIDDYEAKQTLAEQEAYKTFVDKFESSSNIFVYIQTPVLHNNLKGFVSAETWKDAEKNKKYIVAFPEVGFQLTGEETLFDTRFIVRYQEPSEVPEPVLTVSTDSTLVVSDSTQVEDEEEDVYIEDLSTEKYTENYPDGKKKLEVSMKDGFRDGSYREYHANGEIKIKGRYKADQKDGTWKYYDESGKLVNRKKYDNGKEISQ
ncbi:DUF3352 domain-containing protein [Cytophagaceae bacterium DM2B3-1]|uniref:DUF3352 domain-containing protein n=1 Tax=Xanthocytophaga flava TaxID=3048013 RepID=A0ABT7CDA4_9BACT|nr:DUF3352 domain-containing protein [Xanthocytophaga flavus]MDJ1491643.1 DUF3352 domain-containing protein [Xanthocytophaga flavus]